MPLGVGKLTQRTQLLTQKRNQAYGATSIIRLKHNQRERKETMRVAYHVKQTQITIPSTIPIKELNRYEIDLLSRIAVPGGQDTFTTLCNALEISPMHAQAWGPELFALEKPKLASIAYHKAAEFENSIHHRKLTQTDNFSPEGHPLTPFSSLAMTYYLNSFTIAYAEKMIHDIDIDSLNFVWKDSAGSSSSFSYLSFHTIYSYSKLHIARNSEESTFLLKLCLKIRPKWTYSMVIGDLPFYRFILTWKFPAANSPIAYKNLLDIQYYLYAIEKNQNEEDSFRRRLLNFFL